MMKKLHTAPILFFLLIACLACKVKQPISYADLTQGKNLERVPEMPLDSFLEVWMNKTEEHWGMSVKEKFKDSLFTYFRADKKPFFKVNNIRLDQIGFSSLDEQEIPERFYKEVIPLKDRKKEKDCNSISTSWNWEYRYLEEENAIEIRCRYKVKCEFLFTLVNKNYTALYDLNNKTFR